MDDSSPGTYSYPFSERNEVVSHVPLNARTVLDVGCGLGGFGYALRREDPTRTIWGIETNADAARAAEKHYDKILVGPFPDILDDCGLHFECMVFNDVLEHLEDPWAGLQRGVEQLTPNGTVLASIPNVRYLRTVLDLVLRGNWTYTDCGVLDRTHLRFFTKKTMMSLFHDCGLHVQTIRGIHWIGHSRFPLSRFLPAILGDFAYTDFLVAGSRLPRP